MFCKCKGIVLQSIKYGETSLISKILTEQMGVVSFMVKGVRSKGKTNKGSLFQPGTLLDLDFQYNSTKNLQYHKDVKRSYIYQSLPFEVVKSSLMQFVLEVISATHIDHQSNEEEFEFLYNQFLYLDSSSPDSLFPIRFLINYSQYLGFYPDNNFNDEYQYFDLKNGSFQKTIDGNVYVLSAEESKWLNMLLSSENIPDPLQIKQHRIELLKKLILYYTYHIENFKTLNSHLVYGDVFS